MTPAEVADRLAAVLGSDADVAVEHGVVTATVDRTRWVETVTAVRDDDALDGRFFDVLLGTDLGDGELEVVVRLWSVAWRHAVHLRTTCHADDAHLPSLTKVFAGAAWHERETAEMLGFVFDGHPGLVPLLLPTGFAGHPLRKAFVLADRLAQSWPGAVEPGQSAPNPRRVPPGVPAPGRAR
jgi:NADH-quinone oxidoreductase subunit C